MCNLRPKKLEHMIGQKELKDRLNILIGCAKTTNTALPHILFSGGAGLGKTTFAQVLAYELQVPIVTVNSTVWKKVKDILPYLAKISFRSILFCDEIHRLSPKIEEFLYPVMEDFKFNLVSKGQQYDHTLDKFTFIGATTSYGSLAKPLIDRFVHKEFMRCYTVDELAELGQINAKKIGIDLTLDCVTQLAKVSRHTPRILNNYIAWCYKYCLSKKILSPTIQDIQFALNMIGVDDNGLTVQDRKYVSVLTNHFHGGPAGLSTLIATTEFSNETIVNVIEPFLLSQNIVRKTSKGRILI